MARIEGRYPGGPRRPTSASEEKEGEHPRLTTVEEIEERIAEGRVRRIRRLRRRHLLVVLLTVVLLAGGIGAWLGYRSHRTSAEVAEELRRQAEQSTDLRREADRVLNELWKMEDMERAPRPPVRR